ncbi:hypothetical protein [Nocardia sp. NPDC057668]|uniref:hypothetical protein n=1 Tax=Nocardia sp. NPDC057668 TaxID=3346202 RepID=UPI00366B180E
MVITAGQDREAPPNTLLVIGPRAAALVDLLDRGVDAAVVRNWVVGSSTASRSAVSASKMVKSKCVV